MVLGEVGEASGLGVVLVNYDRPELCSRLVRVLADSRHLRTVCVVNNGSWGQFVPTAPVLRGSSLKVRNFATNRGFAAAANVGIRECVEAKCEIVALLNPDLETTATAIDELYELARAAGRDTTLAAKGELSAPIRKGVWDLLGKFFVDDIVVERFRVPVVPAYAWFVPSALFRKLGLFDERFFFGREDTDFCARLALSRKPLHTVQSPHVRHHRESSAQPSYATLRLRAYHMMRGRRLLLNKYLGSPLGARFQIGQFVGLVRDLLASAVQSNRLRKIFWGLRGLVSDMQQFTSDFNFQND